jgi:UDP-2,3-diacylglucosamine pyrophosphatase LpxH
VRTLVVSDLHLGGRLGHDVLSRPEPLAKLLEALDDVDRLVLLGDIVELLPNWTPRAAEVGERVLGAIGARLGAGREVLYVPGNHDLILVRAWIRTQGRTLGIDTEVGLEATPGIARVASWLAPAKVGVHYPGVWLSDRVWATHGHYLDRHLLPESTFGIARGLLGRLPRSGAVANDYEAAGGLSMTRLEGLLSRLLPRALAALMEDAAELVRAATMPRVPRLLFHRRIAPLTATVLGLQMRRASIPALARVVHRLGVEAEWVVFGHVHRLGPLREDRPEQWVGPGGRPRILNTGSWQYEPLLVHRAGRPHPYWPGGAVMIESGRDPVAIGLLDELDASALR